jgi:hypothetical protein
MDRRVERRRGQGRHEIRMASVCAWSKKGQPRDAACGLERQGGDPGARQRGQALGGHSGASRCRVPA